MGHAPATVLVGPCLSTRERHALLDEWTKRHTGPRADRMSAILGPPVDVRHRRRRAPWDEDDLIACARQEYIEGRIEADEFEAALDHIFAGGRGCAAFPYLPVFAMPQPFGTETLL